MDWLQVLTITGATVGSCAFFYKLTKHQVEKIESSQKDFQKSMLDETKNFHGRLCLLEERYLQLMHRILEKN